MRTRNDDEEAADHLRQRFRFRARLRAWECDPGCDVIIVVETAFQLQCLQRHSTSQAKSQIGTGISQRSLGDIAREGIF